jgi:hypothetical protein
MISFSRIDVNEMPWEELRSFDHANIFQTRVWIDFLAEVYGAEPVVAVLKSEGRVQGYFTGLIVKKFGLRILGSPFRGWNTYFIACAPVSHITKYYRHFQVLPFKNSNATF